MVPKYKRILLKLSGESLMGDKTFGFDNDVIAQYANDIKLLTEVGVEVATLAESCGPGRSRSDPVLRATGRSESQRSSRLTCPRRKCSTRQEHP